MNKQLKFYKSLFNKSFFIDKFSFDSIYQCPQINTLTVLLIINSHFGFKFKFYKVILSFYILTGQKPKILVKNYNLRGIRKKKVVGLILNLKHYEFFLNILILRQLALIPFFRPFSLSERSKFFININQKTYDDDILFQLLKISEVFKYQIFFNTNSSCKFRLQTLLINFKIPCQ
jgi:ribosomal protein L5